MKRLRVFSFLQVSPLILLLLAALCFPGAVRASSPKEADNSDLKKLTANIHWLELV